MNGTYTVKTLVAALVAAGLPSTKPTIWTYEKKGIIKRPKTFLTYGERQHRLYTEAEIKKVVADVKKYNEDRGKAI
jgi:hypothetical protein